MPPTESTNWYYAHDGEALGPVTFEFLLEELQRGALHPDVPVIEEGKAEWQALSSILPSRTSSFSSTRSSPQRTLPKAKLLKPRIRNAQVPRDDDYDYVFVEDRTMAGDMDKFVKASLSLGCACLVLGPLLILLGIFAPGIILGIGALIMMLYEIARDIWTNIF